MTARGSAAPAVHPLTSAAIPSLPAVRELAITVSSLPRSVAFFEKLDFVVDQERDLEGAAIEALVGRSGARLRVASLHLGAEHVELRQVVPSVGRAIPEGSLSNDQTFQHMAIVVGDMDAALSRVRSSGAETISPQPQTIPASNPAAGGIRALYFHDPDRHNLELIWFPPGKGNPRWQGARPGVFLGIDHSAIAVVETERSQRFYEGLGLLVAGRSLNFGIEQEALSGVPGARVRITSLAPKAGPSVEFLSYLEPGPGRRAPADSTASDLWHWEITVEVADIGPALTAAERAGGHLVSSGVVSVEPLNLGYARAALVDDLDGHALRLVQHASSAATADQ